MGTVLSFSPRERRPIYTTSHHHHGGGNGGGTISSSNSTSDFQLSSTYAYEAINNAKNRENVASKPLQYLTVPYQFHHNGGGNGILYTSSNIHNIATTTNILNNNFSCSNDSLDERQVDSARILSEKNAIEKNLKKHSLFINALSWKRLSSSHSKKKHLEASNNVKNKSVTAIAAPFRPPALTDVVHPMVVVNEKKMFQHQQQVQLVTTTASSAALTTTMSSAPSNFKSGHQTLFYDPGDPKSLVAVDLERAANNANNLHHNNNHNHHHQHRNHMNNVDKVAPKMSHQLRPIQLVDGQPTTVPRKTIIQVSLSTSSLFI